jgi:hypothetical protein
VTLRGYDWDGVAGDGVIPEHPFVIISGRTFAEYDDRIRDMAQLVPVYIRGVGRFRDHQHAGEFKATIINILGVTEFYEDRDDQIDIIRRGCPHCKVVKVG